MGNIKEALDDLSKIFEDIGMDNYGYHYGDLGKADYKHQFGNRNTGGFGTGTYFVGKKATDKYYSDRPKHKVDFSKYKLFKPSSNERAYGLHDELLWFNNHYDMEVPPKFIDIIKEFDKIENAYFDGHLEDLRQYILKYADYISYDYDESQSINEYKAAAEIENKRTKKSLDFYTHLRNLSKWLGGIDEDKLLRIIEKALNDKSDIAPSTLIMKNLGYEGIDVRHLNKDAGGLQGLDNFGYGSVIYDLKENMINEGRDAPLYHATSIDNLISILKNNTLNLGRTYLKDIKSGRKASISLTRSKEFAKRYNNTILVLDQSKLANNYKIQPEADTMNELNPSSGRRNYNSKAEEIITKPIENIKNYIIKIIVTSEEDANKIKEITPDIEVTIENS